MSRAGRTATPTKPAVRLVGDPPGETHREGEPRRGSHASGALAAARQPERTLSVVIPAYNEQENVRRMYGRLTPVLESLDLGWEIIFSVDPCTDHTEEIILELCEEDPRVRMLRFSRRFGQPMALIAGLEASRGDAAVVIDCDLQDPPELIPEMVERWLEGYDVVCAQRRSRSGETHHQTLRRGHRLSRDAAHRRRRDPRQHGRLPADEQARRRQRRRAEGEPRLPPRPRRPRRISPDEHPVRPRSTRCGHDQIQPRDRLARDRARRDRRLLALSAAADLAARRDRVGARLRVRARLYRA